MATTDEGSRSLDDIANALGRARTEGQNFADFWRNLEITIKQGALAIREAEGSVDSLANQLSRLTGRIDETQSAMQRFSSTWNSIKDAVSSATTILRDANKALDQLDRAQKSVTETARDVKQQTEETVKQQQELSRATQEATQGLTKWADVNRALARVSEESYERGKKLQEVIEKMANTEYITAFNKVIDDMGSVFNSVGKTVDAFGVSIRAAIELFQGAVYTVNIGGQQLTTYASAALAAADANINLIYAQNLYTQSLSMQAIVQQTQSNNLQAQAAALSAVNYQYAMLGVAQQQAATQTIMANSAFTALKDTFQVLAGPIMMVQLVSAFATLIQTILTVSQFSKTAGMALAGAFGGIAGGLISMLGPAFQALQQVQKQTQNIGQCLGGIIGGGGGGTGGGGGGGGCGGGGTGGGGGGGGCGGGGTGGGGGGGGWSGIFGSVLSGFGTFLGTGGAGAILGTLASGAAIGTGTSLGDVKDAIQALQTQICDCIGNGATTVENAIAKQATAISLAQSIPIAMSVFMSIPMMMYLTSNIQNQVNVPTGPSGCGPKCGPKSRQPQPCVSQYPDYFLRHGTPNRPTCTVTCTITTPSPTGIKLPPTISLPVRVPKGPTFTPKCTWCNLDDAIFRRMAEEPMENIPSEEPAVIIPRMPAMGNIRIDDDTLRQMLSAYKQQPLGKTLGLPEGITPPEELEGIPPPETGFIGRISGALGGIGEDITGTIPGVFRGLASRLLTPRVLGGLATGAASVSGGFLGEGIGGIIGGLLGGQRGATTGQFLGGAVGSIGGGLGMAAGLGGAAALGPMAPIAIAGLGISEGAQLLMQSGGLSGNLTKDMQNLQKVTNQTYDSMKTGNAIVDAFSGALVNLGGGTAALANITGDAFKGLLNFTSSLANAHTATNTLALHVGGHYIPVTQSAQTNTTALTQALLCSYKVLKQNSDTYSVTVPNLDNYTDALARNRNQAGQAAQSVGSYTATIANAAKQTCVSSQALSLHGNILDRVGAAEIGTARNVDAFGTSLGNTAKQTTVATNAAQSLHAAISQLPASKNICITTTYITRRICAGGGGGPPAPTGGTGGRGGGPSPPICYSPAPPAPTGVTGGRGGGPPLPTQHTVTLLQEGGITTAPTLALLHPREVIIPESKLTELLTHRAPVVPLGGLAAPTAPPAAGGHGPPTINFTINVSKDVDLANLESTIKRVIAEVLLKSTRTSGVY